MLIRHDCEPWERYVEYKNGRMIMPNYDVTLNIHYSLPDEYWKKLNSVYKTMPFWIGYINGIPYWYGDDSNDKTISASVEPGGLQITAILDEDEWNEWYALLKKRVSDELGFEVGEPAEGYHFYTTT